MKKIGIFFFCFFISSITFGQSLIIRNVNIISMKSDAVLKAQSVRIEDGIIKEISSFNELSKNSGLKIIDANGQYLMPGFADMHVHLPSAENIDNLLKMSIAAGITHIRLMNSHQGSQFTLKKELENQTQRITPVLHYSLLIKRDLKQANMAKMDSIILAAKSNGASFIKLFSLSTEAVFDTLVASAKKNNMIVCGHYPIYTEDKKRKYIKIKKVLNSGFRSIEHLGGYTAIDNDTILKMAIDETIKNEVYNCPTFDFKTMVLHMQYPNKVKTRITNRSLPAKLTKAWPKQYAAQIDKEGGAEKVLPLIKKRLPYFEKNKSILKKLADNNCLLIIGSDGGGPYQAPGFNLWEEMIEWSEVGIDNYTILKAATINSAKFFNEENSWGTIEVGKRADLVLLDKNPLEDIENVASVHSTFIEGRQFLKKDILLTL